MPRSTWNGEIRIAQLRVPVKLFPAVKTRKVAFRQVHRSDLVPVEHKLFCRAEGREIPRSEVVRGYEVAPGEHVVIPDDELKEAAGPNDKKIDVEKFVDVGAIDPVAFDRTYLLGPQEQGNDAYALLRTALADKRRAGLGRLRFHNRERLAAVRAFDDVLVLHMLHGAGEVMPRSTIELAEVEAPSRPEMDMARQLVSAMVEEFDIDRWPDRYRERLLEMIAAKAAGAEPSRPGKQPRPTSDLLDALQASVAAANGRTADGHSKAARRRKAPGKRKEGAKR